MKAHRCLCLGFLLLQIFLTHEMSEALQGDSISHFIGVSEANHDPLPTRLALQLDKKIIKIEDEGPRSNMGVIYRDLGLYDKAIDFYKKSIQTRKKLADEGGETEDLVNLGHIYELTGEYTEAIQFYEQSLAVLKRTGKTENEGAMLNNLGDLYRDIGNYDLALNNYQMALVKFKTNELRKDEGVVQNNIALVYKHLALYEQALESHRLAAAIFRKLGMSQDEAKTFLQIAEVLMLMGRYEQGIKSATDSLQVLQKAGIKNDETVSAVADCYMDLGKISEAETLLSSSESLSSLGRLALLKGDYQSALSYYSREQNRAENAGNAEDNFRALCGLGRAFEALNDYNKAVDAYAKAIDLSENIRISLAPSDRTRFFKTKIRGIAPSEPYKGMALSKIKLNDSGGSIQITELLRARTFGSYMENGYPTRTYGVPRDLIERETNLVNRIGALKNELGATQKIAQKARHESISNLIRQSEKEFDELKEEFWRRFPAYAEIKYPKLFKVAEAQLSPDDRVLILDVFESGVGVKLIHDKKIVKAYFVPYRYEELQKDVNDIRETLARIDLKYFDLDIASTLFKKLLGEALNDIKPGIPITIVPDEILCLLPFNALLVRDNAELAKKTDRKEVVPKPDNNTDLTFLGDMFPLSYSESISSLVRGRITSAKIRPPRNALVVADPVFSTAEERTDPMTRSMGSVSMNHLYRELIQSLTDPKSGSAIISPNPDFSALAKDLENIFPARITLLSGAKASKPDLTARLSANSDGFQSIIFAVPALMTSLCPVVTEPFLALSTVPSPVGGFLALSDIISLRMPSDLIAITSCWPGPAGSNYSASSMMIMAKAFQYAGAKSVLMTLWDVSGASSAKFMEKFFTHLKAGKTKTEALSRAKNEIRKEGYEHPYFWSGYVLYGEP